jgi:branched-subunit amino acid ABC-type transport system permease component
MRLPLFESQVGETIILQSRNNRKWYAVAWKIISGLLAIFLVTFIVYILLSEPLTRMLISRLTSLVASIIVKIFCLGFIPLFVSAWVIEDALRTFTGELVLTDQRFWVRGSPYAWSLGEIPLEDIASITYRRDAIFIRRKSNRQLQVHMFPHGKAVVQTYTEISSNKSE